jgi:integrase
MTGMRRGEVCGLRWSDVDLDAGLVSVRQLLLGSGWNDTGDVFTDPQGDPMHPNVVSKVFARLVKRSELPRVRLHDLRDGHATHMLAAGVNVKVVSERLGHASTSFTLDVYAHVLPSQQADAAAAVRHLQTPL